LEKKLNKPVNIFGIAGSLRRQSFNRAALRAATKLLPAGAMLGIFELDGMPGFNEDDGAKPTCQSGGVGKARARGRCRAVVTPEYNYSVPGVLKNAIYWAGPYGDSAWDGKPAAIMGASIGNIGTTRAQYQLRQIFVFLNIFPINQPEVMIGHAADRRVDAKAPAADRVIQVEI
jgi:chromate reductase, NAD(P)H dehydrogenase (quinone)